MPYSGTATKQDAPPSPVTDAEAERRPVQPVAALKEETAPAIPAYLKEVYGWCYANPKGVWLFDHSWMVNFILRGNSKTLQRAVFRELEPGASVLQASCVFGDMTPNLFDAIGPEGTLEVIDVLPIQLETCRRKMPDSPRLTIRLADATAPGGGPYDAAVSYFLLHEVPDDYKRRIVDALLASLKPGGKAIFIDYHEPRRWHPYKLLTALIFKLFEPFAFSIWRNPIQSFARDPGRYTWRTAPLFGGMFQATVALREEPPAR